MTTKPDTTPKTTEEESDPREDARRIFWDELFNGSSPLDILDDISAVWDGDPMELF